MTKVKIVLLFFLVDLLGVTWAILLLYYVSWSLVFLGLGLMVLGAFFPSVLSFVDTLYPAKLKGGNAKSENGNVSIGMGTLLFKAQGGVRIILVSAGAAITLFSLIQGGINLQQAQRKDPEGIEQAKEKIEQYTREIEKILKRLPL